MSSGHGLTRYIIWCLFIYGSDLPCYHHIIIIFLGGPLKDRSDLELKCVNVWREMNEVGLVKLVPVHEGTARVVQCDVTQGKCYDPRTCRAPIFYFPRALFPY